MVSTEEILITMLARDEASDVFDQVSQNAQSSLGGMSGSISGDFSSMGSSATSTFDNMRGAVSELNRGLMGLSSVSGMVFQELGAKKSASEYIYGTSSAEDTNKVLLKGMQDSEEQGESLYNTIDNATDNALVSMQDIIPALNVIQSGTGATGQEIENVTDKVAQFGSYVLAQTGSIAKSNEAMQALEKGIKGSYQILQHYGVTARSLENVGWGGDPDDIEAFMDAVVEVIGPTEDLMNTSEGLDAQMGKMWSRAGKQIGRELLPYTKSLKGEFLELDRSMGGNLSKGILLVQFGIETLQGKLYQVSTLMESIANMKGGWDALRSLIGGVGQTAQQTAMSIGDVASASEGISQTMGGATQIGADVSQLAQSSGAVPYSNLGGDEIGQMATQMALDSMPMRNPQAEHEASVQEKASNRLRVNREYSQPSAENFVRGNTATGQRVSNILKQTEDLNQETQLTGQLLNATKDYENLSETYSDFVKNGLGNVNIDIPEDEFLSSMGKELEKKKERVKELTKAQEDVNILARLGGSGHNIPTDLIDKNTTSIVKEAIDEVEESTTLTGLLRGKVDGFGASFQNALEKGFGGLGDGIRRIGGISASGIKEGILSFGRNLKDISVDTLKAPIDKITSGLKKVNLTNLKSAFGNLNTSLGESVSNFSFSDIGSKLKGAFKGADAVEEVVEDVAKVGTAGETLATTAPALEASAVGAEATAVAETTLSGAFMGMLVPTLAIAGVVAIMIPVVAGLVIEALFFINLIGQFISAMNFDGINVDGVADKLQELAMVFAWIGVAMASMSFAGIMSVMGTVQASLLSLMGGFPQVVNLLTQVANEIRPLGNVTIDEGVAINLQNLGSALNGISSAMMSLTGVTISAFLGNILTLGGRLGSLSSNLQQTRNDLQKAIDTINSMDFSGIDESKVQQISTVMEAIGNFGSAFDGLLKIRDGAKWSDITNMLLDGIFGTSTETIQQAFQNAHEDLKMASQELQFYNDLETVDEGTAQKIKNVSDSIVAIADALESLAKLKEDKGFLGAIDSFLNGGNDDLISGLDTANVVIRQTASRVRSLSTIANIPDTVTEKITSLNDSLNLIMKTIDAMSQIKSSDDTTKLDKLPGIIQTAHSSIRQISANIAGLKTISNIDPKVNDKLTQLGNALGSVNDALTQIININNTTGGVNFKGLDTKYVNITNSISSLASQLHSLGITLGDGAHQVPDDLSSKLTTLGESASSLSTALKPITSMPKVEATVDTNIKNAVSTINKTAGELNGLKGTEAVDKGVSTVINRVGTSANVLKRVANQMKGFPFLSPMIIGLRVSNAVKIVKDVSKQLKGIGKGDKVDDISGTLKSVQTAMSQLKKTLSSMNFSPQGKNIGSQIKLGVGSGMNGLSTVVSTQVTNGVNGAKGTAKTGGSSLGSEAKTGFQTSFKISDVAKAELDNAVAKLNEGSGTFYAKVKEIAETAVQEAKASAGVQSPGYIARMWGDEMGYSAMMMERRSGELYATSRNVASNVVRGFNSASTLTPKLMNFDAVKSDLNKAQIGTMMELRRPSNMGKTQRPLNIHIGEGAVQLDARNMTMKESRQIMINALEGLDMITGVDVKDNI